MAIVKTFTDYVSEGNREYHYRIKTVSPLTDKDLEYIEHVLNKYILKEITKPVKTIMQSHPLDFTDVMNAEVWIINVITQLPASAYILQQELKLALNLSEKYIIVRSANDPLEVYTQKINADREINKIASKDDLSAASRLSTNRQYDKDERGDLEKPIYGNEYNSELLDAIAKVKAERISNLVIPHSNELNQGGKVVDNKVPTEDDGIFNKDIEAAPKPHTYKTYTDMLKHLRKLQKPTNPRLSTKNNYDDDEIKQTKKFDKYGVDGKVAVVTITDTHKGIRKS